MLTAHYWSKVFNVSPLELGEEPCVGPCVIGHGAWIGQAVSVMAGVTVGAGAVVGANSTVLGDIPPFAIAVGTPAKVIKLRFDNDVVDRLLRVAWWDWDRDVIRENASLLQADLTAKTLAELERVSGCG